MGWRDSYEALLELFPQVDTRLIKGAALEHGSDVGAAAEFILNEVLDQEEENLSSEQPPEPAHHVSINSIRVVEPRNGCSEEEQTVAAFENGFDPLVLKNIALTQIHNSGNEEPAKRTDDGSCSSFRVAEEARGSAEDEEAVTAFDSGPFSGESEQDEQKDLFATCSDSLPCSERRWLSLSEIETAEKFESQGKDAAVDGSARSEPAEEGDLLHLNFDGETSGDRLTDSLEDVKLAFMEKKGEGEIFEVVPGHQESGSNEDDGPQALIDLVHEEDLIELYPILPPELEGLGSSALMEAQRDDDDDGIKVRLIEQELVRTFGTYRGQCDETNLMGEREGTNFMDDEFPIYDGSISVPRSVCAEDNAAALDDGLDSMLSIQKSDISEEMDRADWENINTTSITQLNQMEPLDNLVEEAKADKEALISSIEEIRVLRLMTDQAEYDARQSREAAARGGADVMAKVAEMRKMLCRARDANAVHAGEVFGEKAVLVTEARELQQRLAQVNSEKAKALAALNEIKESLQARIQSAIREREAAEEETVQMEEFAKAALAKEEALVAKVAQESRDLEAEAETCSKIRDFLIERGSIVDALQGEVAVLREDAEALKKDLESMSLSYSGSGFHKPLLSQTGSEIYNSMLSGSGKLVLYGDMSDTVLPGEKGAPSSGGNSAGPSSLRSSGIQKASGDKKAWSSLPSLLRGLSNSQDLSGSGHSTYSSSASNSISSFRESLAVNQGDKSQVPSQAPSQLPSGANSLMEMKYPSTPNSPEAPESPAGTQEERDRRQVTMALFPGEELEMEYNGVPNLDVFRTVKPDGSDDDDWQILEKGSSASSSPSSVRK